MMILSFGLILISGFVVGTLLNKIKIPGLVGMILVGLLLGPTVLNIIDPKVLDISSELRQIALVIILTRSGLNLDLESLKKIGRPAILMSFIPATFEIVGIMVASYFLLHLSWSEGLLLGSVLAAVSPAVVSPRMIGFIEKKYGEDKGVPKLVLAGSSVDDIYVVILFYSFLGLVQNQSFDCLSITMIPVSIILGVILGVGVGLIVSFIFKKTSLKTVEKVIITLALSFLMIGLENLVKEYVSVSSLLAIMVMAMTILFSHKESAKELSVGYNNLWKVFEIILFVLVGASLNLSTITELGFNSVFVLLIGLLFRSVGVYLSLLFTNLSQKERVFCILSYLPKATVQASIGGIALSYGLDCGAVVLAISILSILITAPVGAFLIDFLGPKILSKKEELIS